MILIADSGSSKTDWFFSNGENSERFTTGGANPFFRNTADLVKEWKASPVNGISRKASRIYFYAAGVVDEEKAHVIRKALQEFFRAADIRVESDLLAAAHATLGAGEGIACILGTGSNSCRFDGQRITAHVPPLGFILGDEGSGAVLGRQLVGDYLKKNMPEPLRHAFHEKYPYAYAEFLNRVYRQEKPNRFLAGFVPFLKDNIGDPYCSRLVEEAFEQFIVRNVSHYEDYREQKICFAGSVAYSFQDQLKKVLLKKNLMPGVIVKEPLINLIKFHLQQH